MAQLEAYNLDTLGAVVDRAVRLGADRSTVALALLSALMPRDLDRLATFGTADFAHDVGGILAHLDPATDTLRGGFLPRCVS